MDSLVSGDLGNIVIPAVMDGISNSRGEAFFKAITQRMSLAVDADYIFIGRLIENDTKARTIVVCNAHELIPNFVYDLKDTPCERVVTASAQLHSENLQEMFPRDLMLADMNINGYYGSPLSSSDGVVIGLLVVMYENTVPDPGRVESIFDLFAGRISAEIESTEKTLALELLNKQLEERVEARTIQLEAAKLKAEEADAAKSVFLACMSHEIRTPMNSVLGMAELLETTDLNVQQSVYLKALCESGGSLMHVVDDILDYTKIFTGELDFINEDFVIVDWITSLTTPYSSTLPADVKFHVEFGPDLADRYNADRSRLQQVLTNLLNNAVKFTSAGNIHLKVQKITDQPGGHVLQFSVTDTGIGIAVEDLEQIFEPFTQAGSSITRKYGGTGLGLSICKRIATSMNGEIAVESVEARGCSFHFTVPLRIVAEKSVAESEEVADTTYSDLKILLVEDNLANQFLTVAQLQILGITPTIADNGAVAVKILCEDQEEFDLVLMDCEMPVMDGFEATRDIRAWEQARGNKETLIYALTAHVLSQNTGSCEEVGMDGKLTKPIKIADYVPVLDRASNANTNS
ncbi:MAG: signal transduction histidine kinase [Halioglobus sp.]|jgi:signal transduction histidine kinase